MDELLLGSDVGWNDGFPDIVGASVGIFVVGPELGAIEVVGLDEGTVEIVGLELGEVVNVGVLVGDSDGATPQSVSSRHGTHTSISSIKTFSFSIFED